MPLNKGVRRHRHPHHRGSRIQNKGGNNRNSKSPHSWVPSTCGAAPLAQIAPRTRTPARLGVAGQLRAFLAGSCCFTYRRVGKGEEIEGEQSSDDYRKERNPSPEITHVDLSCMGLKESHHYRPDGLRWQRS